MTAFRQEVTTICQEVTAFRQEVTTICQEVTASWQKVKANCPKGIEDQRKAKAFWRLMAVRYLGYLKEIGGITHPSFSAKIVIKGVVTDILVPGQSGQRCIPGLSIIYLIVEQIYIAEFFFFHH